ncbi:hypothetical protein CIL05_05340 [Virgibacillus profundi]|uniref:Uncharacterized protein n=1 Tax=Virgibacillus profundi TaxID=2024555 RepID=A0A2A2IGT2_9BACI|nr:hypothetical protein [Virgibacillus profundi]PAV30526.1 hypothetical protein CIL05_05340 [Virgibacillus profundi]PXY54698.1 hypothetical protein CIT14_05425 [Virgibacillus profundi]
MMRYWKIISITIISIFAIGAFYIQSALAEKNSFPDYTITTKSGDEEAVKRLMLQGTYYGEGEQGQGVTIQKNEVAYSNNNSLLELINPNYIDPKIKRLQKEYRSFMRGKENNIAPFYENEKLLVYADVDLGSMINDSDFTFDIEVLEKESDETEAFELDVPEKNKYAYIYVEAVQMAEGELKVITRQSVKRLNQNEFHVYRFDVSTQKLISDDLIASYQEENDIGWSYTDLISSSNTSGEENKYIAFVKTILEDVQGEDGEVYSEEVAKELVTYNLESKQMKSTELPDEINGESHNAVLIGTMIYFGQESEAGGELIAYNIESEEIDSSQTIDQLLKGENNGLLMKVHEGKMYVANYFSDRKTPGGIAIIELDTGEKLYEGFVNVENPKTVPPGYELILNEIMVQE